MTRTSRRRFIQAGIAGTLLLAGAAVVAPVRPARDAPPHALDARVAELIDALAPVVLGDAFPAGATARAEALVTVRAGFERALSGLDPAVQDEIAQMLSLLVYAPSRLAVAGVWSAWPEASAQEIAAFLEGWRQSRFALKRSGCRALSQLIQAAWYDTPGAWTAIGYPGPPQVSA